MNRLKTILLSLSLLLSFSLAATPVGAQPLTATLLKGDACQGLSQLDSSEDCSSKGSSINGVVKGVVNIISLIVGFAAIIVIVLSGMKFITSSGDSNKAASARTSLVYALVGLVIAALAQFLVHFVLFNASHPG